MYGAHKFFKKIIYKNEINSKWSDADDMFF